METTKKDLEYYRKNAEEDYLTVPISVLRYITEMEQALRIQRVSKRSELYFAFMKEYNALMGESEHQILKEEVVVLLAKYSG